MQKVSRGVGAKFRHTVMTQINFMGRAEQTTILRWFGNMPRQNFAKLHYKYAFSCILEASLVYTSNAFTRLIRRMKS